MNQNKYLDIISDQKKQPKTAKNDQTALKSKVLNFELNEIAFLLLPKKNNKNIVMGCIWDVSSFQN